MATYQKFKLSASTGGKPIPVVATSTPGTTIHEATSSITGYDEIYMWASNVTAAAVALTVEWGDTSDPGSHLVKGYSVPANSLPVPIALGQVMQTALLIAAFAGTASAINITGFVNRIE